MGERRSQGSRGQPRAGDTITAHEANHGRETHSRLARGQPWAGYAITARPRPTSGGIHSHGSFEANSGLETQSRLVRGQLRAGYTVTVRSSPTLGGRRSHGSFEANNSGTWSCFTILIMFVTHILHIIMMFVVPYLCFIQNFYSCRNVRAHT
jgi:hypothetical protein